jgi:hypothetical protein
VNIAWETFGSNVGECGVDHSILGGNILFPQLRTDIHVTLIAESQACPGVRELFHQHTALITTTSFISLIFFDCFCETLWVCENPHFSAGP